jgi:hypothetical protein
MVAGADSAEGGKHLKSGHNFCLPRGQWAGVAQQPRHLDMRRTGYLVF